MAVERSGTYVGHETKPEIQNPKFETNSNHKFRRSTQESNVLARFSIFEFRTCFEFRISGFEFPDYSQICRSAELAHTWPADLSVPSNQICSGRGAGAGR
jgi:hypothetical protein